MTLEAPIETYLCNRVKALGGIALKGDVPGRVFIDRICILPGGRVVFVEVKRPKGWKLAPHQIETIGRLTALGHEVHLVKTKEEVDALFD